MGAAAHAQLGLYGEYSATKISGITCGSPAPIPCSSGGGQVNPSGIQGGLYYDFKNFGPIRLGADVRGGATHSNKSAVSSAGGKDITFENTFLGGVRGVFRTPFPFLKPYAEVAAGWSRNNATNAGTANFIQYEAFAGADIHILPVIDLRAIELGIGNTNSIGTSSGSFGVKTIGVGVVLHLP